MSIDGHEECRSREDQLKREHEATREAYQTVLTSKRHLEQSFTEREMAYNSLRAEKERNNKEDFDRIERLTLKLADTEKILADEVSRRKALGEQLNEESTKRANDNGHWADQIIDRNTTIGRLRDALDEKMKVIELFEKTIGRLVTEKLELQTRYDNLCTLHQGPKREP